jgi:uncharacterized protein YecT (DUF1311 family)
MQGLNIIPGGIRAARHANRLPLLALGALLAACQIPHANSAAVAKTDTSSAITAASPATEQVATPPDQATAAQHAAAAATAGHAPIDADGNPYHPDDSYSRANLRTEYKNCVAVSSGVSHAIHACLDEEFRWQQARLRNAWGIIADGPDSEYKDRLADEQHAYMSETYQNCGYDPIAKNPDQLIDALPCLTNRYANRADVLEELINSISL